MPYTDWISLLLLSFAIVILINALLASFIPAYYSKASIGKMTHSQLRVKQGNATLDHRLNVFAQSIVFSLVNFKVCLATIALFATILLLTHYF